MLDGNEPKHVALYSRVSTKESTERQHVENQLRELRDFCSKQGWEVIGEYVDHESGTKADREQFKLLFTHAHQRKFDAVVFWALDRFSREGVRETLNHLNRLESVGVSFVSYSEPYVNSLGVWRDAVLGFIAAIAKQEVVRRSERVRAGMARAKAEGKRVSRGRIATNKQRQIKKLFADGVSKKEIARQLNISPKTVRNYLNVTI